MASLPTGVGRFGRQGAEAMDGRLERAEEELAHLRRALDDLSDVVARQAREIERLDRRVALLMERAAEAEAAAGGAAPLADQKPPHW